MKGGSEYRRALVSSQFHRARRRAAIESILSRFSGQPAELLSFAEVADQLGISGQSSIGLRQIPIDAIVGSVGRYQDFTRTFLPRVDEDEDRWVNVGAAATTIADLPPIDVYKLGDAYFVIDGNHRVSLARQQRVSYIDANVVEVRTRVPMPPGADPDQLIIAAELREFLAYTRLDNLYPDCDMRVSVPGQYRHLEGHIEAYRFILEAGEECELALEEAVRRWYDEAYMPMIEAIREQGILRYFPGRTETDFFVWLARHRAELQNQIGYTITPDVAVSRLLGKVEEAARGPRPPLTERLRRLTRLNLGEPPRAPQQTWAQERTLYRYSDHLFAAMLLPLAIAAADSMEEPHAALVERALTLAQMEEARLCILCIIEGPEATAAETQAINAIRRRLDAHPVETELLISGSDPLHWIKKVGYLTDLVIVDRALPHRSGGNESDGQPVQVLIEHIQRPVLVFGLTAESLVPRRVLLVHDTRRRLDEAIFLAAYLAERWGAALAVLPLSNGRDTETVVSNIESYLTLHEVTATFFDPVRPDERAAEQMIRLGQEGDFDLLLLTGPGRGKRTNQHRLWMQAITSVLDRWPRAALIAT